MATSISYPITVRGDITEPISRGLFLIKWLLIVPHLVVLSFLFIGLIVSWVISLFAILFTGKYPRSLFNYNVGVLRWSWRVGFYSYQALGTDRYPTFSLSKRDDYPADLEWQHPETLSRGLVLVKWWLLAIPHYIILLFLQGGVGFQFGGLQLILVLIAAIANLFTGKYPQGIWDLVMGINRWSYQVCGYTLLTTDRYPPFTFDA